MFPITQKLFLMLLTCAIESRSSESFCRSQAPVTRYRIRIGAISILGVFQTCLLLNLFIFDVFV